MHLDGRVYSHEIRQLFLTKNTGANTERITTSEKLKFDCKLEKGKKLHECEKLCFYNLRCHY